MAIKLLLFLTETTVKDQLTYLSQGLVFQEFLKHVIYGITMISSFQILSLLT